ncbi:CHC2 zinc finger domain-containing protein [Lachnospiraceae bacterium 42-17]|jgi:transposase-like protein
MYDMSRFDYDIRDVVRVLNLTIRRKNAQSYDVDCPFCGHKAGKLNINFAKNVFRCNYCNEQGGMLDLYCKLYHVTKSEANRQIRDALNLGQYRDDYQRQTKVPEIPIPVNSDRAPDIEINHTYSQMLSMLTLSRKHQEDLLGRGLTLEQIAAQRYRSVPLFGIKRMVEKLKEKGCTLQGVPGFYQKEEGTWSIQFSSRNSGILIPIRSMEGLIQGFQIRLDHVSDSRKYIWLSSANYQMGVSSGSPVHVIGSLDAETVYVTEGALKGTIAHYLSGDTFLCAPGVGQHKSLRPILESLSGRKLKFVYEAYDMDKKMRIACDGRYKKCGECMEAGKYDYCPFKKKKREIIQNGCKKLYEICRELSLPIQRMLWNTDGKGEWRGEIKGIDDLYYAMKKNNIEI